MKDEIYLAKPTKELEPLALAYRKEHFDCGENIIYGSELFDNIMDYDEWLTKVTNNAHKETVDKHWVLTDTYFAMRNIDHTIIGIIDLRYSLNEFLKDFGHCGYSVRPSLRNQGYASEMLSQVCRIAKLAGMKHLQLSVEKDNLPSIKTILKNGGVYQRSFTFHNQLADIYIITL